MKKIVLAVLAATTAVSGAQATPFTFTDTFTNGSVFTGSFDGTASGNLITDISNIAIAKDGVAFSGTIYNEHFDAGYVDGGAVVSFDGTQNNFAFFNMDYVNTHTGDSFLISISDLGLDLYNVGTLYNYQGPQGSFSVAVAAVPEPASWTMMIGGFGLIGIAMRRKKTSISFA